MNWENLFDIVLCKVFLQVKNSLSLFNIMMKVTLRFEVII